MTSEISMYAQRDAPQGIPADEDQFSVRVEAELVGERFSLTEAFDLDDDTRPVADLIDYVEIDAVHIGGERVDPFIEADSPKGVVVAAFGGQPGDSATVEYTVHIADTYRGEEFEIDGEASSGGADGGKTAELPDDRVILWNNL